MRYGLGLLFFVFGFWGCSSHHTAHPPMYGKALVYKGPGACDEGCPSDGSYCARGCADSSADVARAAGFTPVFVGPNALPENATDEQVYALFGDARVWIQSGGLANQAFNAMTTKLLYGIHNFVAAGGGYVGFCAGAFMATSRIGSTRQIGLSIFPGYTGLYGAPTANSRVVFSMQHVAWQGQARTVYYEGGAYIYGVDHNPKVEAVSRYGTGDIAAARTVFEKGRVFLSGFHPEAPQVWSAEDGIADPDGSDRDLAVQMVQWAGQVTDR